MFVRASVNYNDTVLQLIMLDSGSTKVLKRTREESQRISRKLFWHIEISRIKNVERKETQGGTEQAQQESKRRQGKAEQARQESRTTHRAEQIRQEKQDKAGQNKAGKAGKQARASNAGQAKRTEQAAE